MEPPPALGDHVHLAALDDLEAATAALRAEGISLCLDLVLNHTAKEHAWAEAARHGSPEAQSLYRMFDSDLLPKEFVDAIRPLAHGRDRLSSMARD